ncbi:Cyclin-dependent kinase G-2 [Hibiscus syriacus]|uniref:cyclin-dependent kinase n=1 Tax=Hibiscus syriacus TaxID=106335 RepID=A0A6A3AXF8_HIBSY|nr:cyclin-dependent kinase G-2-like [Hibiscus syriacus]KAE8707469.1 Cyclin-dependent kinase G-2 [Hibiscus syriacus]
MAAGRVDVRRRIDVEKVNREYGHTNPVKNVCNYPPNSKNSASFHKSKLGLGPKRCGLDNVARVKNDVRSMLDNEAKQPPQKKRKFSPIVWDLENKELSSSSKTRVIATTTSLSSPPSPVKLSNSDSNQVDKQPPVSADLIKEERSPPESLVSNSGAALSPSPSGQGCQDDEQEKDLMGKDSFQTPNLFTSRWASDDDDEDGSLTEEKIRSSSLESGEFEREELEGDGVQSDERSNNVLYACKGEDKGCKLDSGYVMDIDDIREEDAIADQSDLDVEESAGSGMNMLLGCRSVFEYERLNKISEGTYGIVYRAKDKKTGEIVALKKEKILGGRDLEEYGFPVTSLREINILASFLHPSIVKVKEVVVDDHDSVYMVMEYMEHDLKWLMDSMKRQFSTSDVKSLMLQLLEGVKYLHDNWVLHRDLKTSNLLLNNQGELKICDFGMARLYGSPLKPYTTKVVTQWYRAPELLLGAKKYSTAVDMWSVGCIMAELLTKEPVFKGTNEIDQLRKIFDTLGVPNEKIWPGFSELPGAKANYSKQLYNLLRKKFPVASFTGSAVLSDAGFDLLNRLLTYDPEKRITADDALNHDWFREIPLPKSKEFFPTFPPKV